MICSVKDCTEEGAVGTNEQQSVTGTQPAIGAQEPSANFAPATVSEVTITISPRSYSPKSFAVKAGSVVTVNLVNTSDSQSCTQSFTIPKLKIQKVVTMGNSSTFTFTAPTSPGPVAFMCGMGMYRGVINVL
jgi:plastocyanin domain-containing protein